MCGFQDNGANMLTKSLLPIQLFVTLAISAIPTNSIAQSDSGAEKVAGKIVCSAWSGDVAKFPAWQDRIVLSIFPDGGVAAERPTPSGNDFFKGIIAPSGAILISGKGKFNDGRSEWTYEFKGQKSKTGDTVLKGKLITVKGGIGARDCSITY
jgi:hypothetical protein